MVSRKSLIAFDFDRTICSTSSLDILGSGGDFQEVLSVEPVGSKEKCKYVFTTLIQSGYNVCIVSNNPHLDMIQQYLKITIGLEDELFKKIVIVAEESFKKFPNKNKHIEHAKNKLQFQGSNDEIYLIDDSEDNIEAARLDRFKVILANPDTGSHLDEILMVCGLSPFVTKVPLEVAQALPILEASSPVANTMAEPELLDGQVIKCKLFRPKPVTSISSLLEKRRACALNIASNGGV